MKSYLPPLFILFLFVLLACNPKEGILAASEGLSLWYSQVLPALFPSMVLTSLLVRSNLLAALLLKWRLTKRLPVRLLLAPAAGLLCGYPIGAKTCFDLYRLGSISKEEAGFLGCFVHFPSPMFLLGFVCTTCLPQADKTALLAAVYLPLPLLAVLAGIYFRKSGIPLKKSDAVLLQKPCFSMELFDDVYNKSVGIMIKIAGYLIFFTILNRLLALLLPDLSVPLCIVSGILEMTYGIRAVSSAALFTPLKECICVFFLGFGGLSGMLQVRDALTAELFSPLRYLSFRLLHGFLAAGIYLLLAG